MNVNGMANKMIIEQKISSKTATTIASTEPWRVIEREKEIGRQQTREK